ncbi:hypothetical protein HK405_006830, partial [Cladochytrium tenue]
LVGEKETYLELTLKFIDRVDHLKDLRAVFKQATRIKFTALVEDNVSRKVERRRALYLNRLKVGRAVAVSLQDGAPTRSKSELEIFEPYGKGFRTGIIAKIRGRLRPRSVSSTRSAVPYAGLAILPNRKSISSDHADAHGFMSNVKAYESLDDDNLPVSPADTASVENIDFADDEEELKEDHSTITSVYSIMRIDSNTILVTVPVPTMPRSKAIAELTRPDTIIPDILITHHLLVEVRYKAAKPPRTLKSLFSTASSSTTSPTPSANSDQETCVGAGPSTDSEGKDPVTFRLFGKSKSRPRTAEPEGGGGGGYCSDPSMDVDDEVANRVANINGLSLDRSFEFSLPIAFVQRATGAASDGRA